jgi:hypothetical protein
MPAVFLVTSAVMSIPASIAISKLRYPETEEPLTKGKITVSREKSNAQNGLHAFSNGAWFGLRVAGLILCNVLTIIALVHVVDGILAYVGRSFLIDTGLNRGPLSLELIFSYLFYPLAWLMGVPKQDLITVARLLGIKFTQNEFVSAPRWKLSNLLTHHLDLFPCPGRLWRVGWSQGYYDHTRFQHCRLRSLRLRKLGFPRYPDWCLICTWPSQKSHNRESSSVVFGMWFPCNLPDRR